MASSTNFLGRDEYRKQKELEEARKAGTAPAELDDEGNEINPHIPQYIAQAPWYLDAKGPGLKHQRNKEREALGLDIARTRRGVVLTSKRTKFRKGACENCGAMTHKTKDCVERPRKLGAAVANRTFAPDEFIYQNDGMDFDAKRDRWKDYDPEEYTEIIERYQRTELERKKLKARRLQEEAEARKELEAAKKGADGKKEGAAVAPSVYIEGESDSEEEEDLDYKETEEQNRLIQKHDASTRTTVRNLRMREDTAKYLHNLDVNSAYYDPKTRSMRANPRPDKEAVPGEFMGDNFVRTTGDAPEVIKQQLFAWDSAERGQEVHMQGLPTHLELMRKKVEENKAKIKERQRRELLKRYCDGEEGKEETIPRELLLSQSEAYVEYTAEGGRVHKGEEEKVKAKTKYEEDVYHMNHTSVWGSYWENGQWGYACCKQLRKDVYCSADSARTVEDDLLVDVIRRKEAELERIRNRKRLHEDGKGDGAEGQEEGEGEEDEEELERKRRKRIRDLTRKELARQKSGAVEKDERKMSYNSLRSDSNTVSQEEMEAYRLAKLNWEDPLKKK